MKKMVKKIHNALLSEIMSLNSDRYGLLNDKESELIREIRKIIKGLTNPSTQKNQTPPNESRDYPDNYSIKPLVEQIEILAEIGKVSPKYALEYAKKIETMQLPEQAEGWFAIYSNAYNTELYYQQKMDEIIARLSRFRPIYQGNSTKGYFDIRDYLKTVNQTKRTAQAYEKIERRQKGPILIIPAQFGKRHTNMVVKEARKRLIHNEFGLDLLATTSMLITHPQRLITTLDSTEWSKVYYVVCLGNELTKTTTIEISLQNILCDTTEHEEDEKGGYSYPTGFLINESIYD